MYLILLTSSYWIRINSYTYIKYVSLCHTVHIRKSFDTTLKGSSEINSLDIDCFQPNWRLRHSFSIIGGGVKYFQVWILSLDVTKNTFQKLYLIQINYDLYTYKITANFSCYMHDMLSPISLIIIFLFEYTNIFLKNCNLSELKPVIAEVIFTNYNYYCISQKSVKNF